VNFLSPSKKPGLSGKRANQIGASGNSTGIDARGFGKSYLSSGKGNSLANA
jgi:hypothetical protein